MARGVAVQIVPEVISVEEQGVVDLHQTHAVLPVHVVWLSLGPVEPLNSLVLVRPEPFSRSVLTVSLPSEGSHPEVGSVSRLIVVEQPGLEPVVDARVVNLSDPGIVELTEQVGVISGDSFSSIKPETSAA